MSKSPLVTIIITTFNNLDDTKECLTSLKKITYNNYKIVVIDNNSTDGTIEYLQKKGIKFHIIKEQGHYSKCINKGFIESIELNSKYSLILNNDTIVDKYFLEKLVKCAESNYKIGIVAPKMYYYNEPNRLWYAGAIANLSRGDIRHRGIGEIDKGQYDITSETGYCTGACALFSNKMLKHIGLINENFEMYVSDVELSIRAQKFKYKTMYEPSSIIWHKVSKSLKGQTYLKEYYKTIFCLKLIRNESLNGSMIYSLSQIKNALIYLKKEDFKSSYYIVKGLIKTYFTKL